MRITTSRLLLPAAMLLCLAGCHPDEPVRLGFVGGISGRVADLGTGGRNGAILAVEERNAAGGIRGRRIELLVRDDQQNPDLVRTAVTELADGGVAAIIGPVTSAMAMVAVPIAEQRQLLIMGATVTTNELSGKDDMFFRTLSASRDYAAQHAAFLSGRGYRRAAVVYDLRNKSYTESWLADFREALGKSGGKIALSLPFESGDRAPLRELAAQLTQAKPDVIVLITNSLDAALLAQAIRKINTRVHLHTAEWAGTERLIELGGRAIEGATTSQFIDRDSRAPQFQKFRASYRERFGEEPGFPGLVVYNATNVILEALAQQQAGEHLKQTILRIRVFPGLQYEIAFDAYGDTRSRTYMTRISDGRFVHAE